MKRLDTLLKGIVRENPIFVLVLGMCPTLGTTSSAFAGMSMGLATLFVLVFSNVGISLVKDFIPSKVRIPAYIVLIASIVTALQMLIQAYLPDVYEKLGIFIPLIVVNCIVLGRAEAFASKNSTADSALDAIGIGVGFTMALTLLGSVREVLGGGTIFGMRLYGGYDILGFVLAPGAFIALAYIMAIFNRAAAKSKRAKTEQAASKEM